MGDLTTLASFKTYAGVAVTTDDVVISSLITAYSAYVQQWMNRNILTQTYSETYNGRDHIAQMLPQWPVTAVSAVTIDGVSIPARTSATGAGYFTDGEAVILASYSFAKGRANVTISYTAGYATVPAELAQAVNELVNLRYKLRDKQEWSSKSLAGETVSLVTKDMPDSVRSTLNMWRAVVPV
jgi:uncharacterized phiE125 gp8 family phage protein